MANERNTSQEGADKAAEAYADNREISVQDGAGYPFKQEIMRAFIVGASWHREHPTGGELLHVCNKTAAITKREMIDKACDWLAKSTILAETTIERFKQAMEL